MVGGELDPADKVSWLGDDRDKTFIKANASFPTSNSYAFVFSDSSDVNDVEFKNLTLDGNGNLGERLIPLRPADTAPCGSVTHEAAIGCHDRSQRDKPPVKLYWQSLQR